MIIELNFAEGDVVSEGTTLLTRTPLLPNWLTRDIDYTPIANLPSILPVDPQATEAETYMEGLKAQHDELLQALNDDEQLLMVCWHGHEKLEVTSISMPSHNVVAMRCIDETGATIQVTGHMNAVTFCFRVNKIEPPVVRKPIGFAMPRPE